jgi:hypothetical protein
MEAILRVFYLLAALLKVLRQEKIATANCRSPFYTQTFCNQAEALRLQGSSPADQAERLRRRTWI